MADDTDTLTQDKPQTDRFGGVRVGAQQRDKFGGIKVGAAPAAAPEASNNKLADIASGFNQTVGGVLSGAGAWLSGPPTPGMLNERAMERAYRESDASQRNYARILPQEPAYQSTAQRPGEGASRTLDEIQSNPLNRYGQFVSETGEMFAPKNPTTVDKILQGVGGFAPIVATGPAAPLTMGLQATGESLKNQYDKYKKQGMTDEEASRQALTVAKGTGITQALLWEIAPKPIKNAVQKVTGKVGGNALAKFLIRRASGATEGAALGGSSQALYNLTTGQPIQQGVAPAAGAMAVIGGITPQPELKEKQYATTEKQVKEGVQPQRQEGNAGGKATETGGGNSLQRPTEGKPTVPPEIDKAARLNELRAIKDPTTEQKTELAALEKASKATNDRIAFVLKQKPGWQFREVPQATETEGLSPEQKSELKNINDKYGWEFSRPIPGGMADTVYVPVGSSYSEIVKALNDKEEQMAGGDKANAAGLPNHLSPFADLFEDPHVFGPAKLEKAGLTRAEVIQKLQDLAKTRKPEQFQDMAAWVVDPAHQARTPNGALSAMRFNFDPDPELHEKEMAKKRLPQPPQPAPKPMPEPDISGEPTDEERLKQINKGIRKASGGGRPEKGEEQVPLQVGETVNRVINGQPVTGKVIQNGSQIIVAFRQGNREVGDHDLSQWTRGKGADRPVGDIAYPQDKFIKDFLKETRIKQKGRVAALPTVLEEHYPGLMEEARVGEEKYRNQLLQEGITPGPGSPIMTALAEAAKAQDEWNRNQATGRYYLGASQEKVDRAIEALRQLLGEKSPVPSLAAEGLKGAISNKDEPEGKFPPIVRVPTEKELAAKAARAKYEALKADQPYSKATKAAREIMLDAEHEKNLEDIAKQKAELAVSVSERERKSQGGAKPGPEAGFGIVPQPPKFLSEFVKQDVAPFVGRAVDAARAAKNLIVHAFSPSTGVKPEDVDILYSSKGFKEKFITQAAAALETARKEMGKLPHDQQIAFVDRIKLGQKQPTPEMQHMADVLRTWDDKLYNMAKEFAPGLNYLDDHYRVLWKVIPGSQGLKGAALEQFMAKRPWRGSRGFQLRHVLDTMSEGIAKGGVPVSYNPIEMFMLHAQDVTKFVSANRAWRNFKDSGAVEFVKTGKERPPGYVKVDDSIARPYFKTDEGVLAKTGEYYMEPNSARMLNNYLSRDHMRTGAFGNIGTGLMDLKNATTSIELSASPFHAVFETNEAVGSALGLAIAKMGEGRLIEGGSEFLRTLPGTLPIVGGFIPKTGNMEALKLGSKIVEFAKSPDDFRAQYPDAYKFLKQKYPDFEEMVDDMFTGGGQIGMHENYHIQAAKGLQEAWANKNYIGAGLRGIPAGLQLALRPIFDIYIPRLKLGTWAREYAFELERRAPELQKGTLTRNTLARDTWAFVEDRFGELNWDNLYWNRTFKSVLQLMFRSVTWKLGNIRGFGKAVRDAGHELGYNWYKDTMVGEMARAIPKGPGAVMERFRNAPSGQISTPKITLPMAWMAGMALVTTIQSTILSKLFTGKYPWQLATGAADLVRNLTYPRISNNDPSQRVNIPTYWKDMIHLVHDPVSYVRSSMTGEIGRIFDIWQNKDFYGREVYHPDDPMLKRVADRFAHLIPVPFSASSVYAARQSGASRVQSGLGMVGYTKAPYYVSHSKAEQAADELIRNSLPLGARTKEEYNKTIREKQGVMAIKRGEMTMEQAVDQGLIADNRQKEAMNQSDESVLMYHFTRLKPEDQLKVYKLATKDERDQLSSKGENMHDMIEDKIFRSRSLSDDEKDQLTTELEELTNETK